MHSDTANPLPRDDDHQHPEHQDADPAELRREKSCQNKTEENPADDRGLLSGGPGGKRVIHLALAWLLARPGVSVALWGARHPGQLDPLSEIADIHLDDALMQEIDDILRTTVTDPVGPEFMAPPTREERAA